jgi:hypothetical protein
MKKYIMFALLMMVGTPLLLAVDSTYHIRVYSDQGRSAGYTVNEGLTSVLDADGNYGISTANRYQLARRVKSVPVTLATAGEDTTWTQLLTVPAGQTITITEILLSAHTELSGNNDSCWASVLYEHDDNTLDTCVAMFPTDADSIAYDDTVYTLTLVDSVFTAGEILTLWNITLENAATGGEGAAITIEYLLDE